MVELRDFDAAEYLDDPAMIAHYLQDALADSEAEFLFALGVVARAKGMTQIARDVGVTRPALYRSLEAGAHPDFRTILRVLASLDVGVRVEPVKPAARPKRKKSAPVSAEA